jgi:hypothetical protein
VLEVVLIDVFSCGLNQGLLVGILKDLAGRWYDNDEV